MNLYNERIGSTYFKYAIIKCYNNPNLLNSLNDIFNLIASDFGTCYNSIRPAMRNALTSVNKSRNSIGNKGVFKLFENEDTITPKNFIRIVTTHFLKYKR